MEWKDVFTPPFESTGGILIFDAKNRFSLNTFMDEENTNKVLNKLNGTHNKRAEHIFSLSKDSQKILYNNVPILWIRAWGRLTGVGGLNLDPELAFRLQSDFANWIVKTLNS